MIIMDLKFHNVLGFKDIHFNFSYPRKIKNNTLGDECLKGIPNFRYKKVNIIMGSNSNGKSSLGIAIWKICMFFTASPQCEKSSHCIRSRPRFSHQKKTASARKAAHPGVSTRRRKPSGSFLSLRKTNSSRPAQNRQAAPQNPAAAVTTRNPAFRLPITPVK